MRRYYLKEREMIKETEAIICNRCGKEIVVRNGKPGKAYLVQTANGGIFRRRTEKGIILICANLVMMIL